MTLLGQQELMTPAPRRRLIVPAGCESYWGVDPSTKRISIAWITAAGERGAVTDSFPTLEGAARLDAIYHTTRRVACLAPFPGLVFVEQPSGKQQNPNLLYAVGATLAGLYAALGPRVYIEMVTSSWWKRRACGRGDISKPKLGDQREYGVLTWARQNGYVGSSWDEADAYGIAEAARREVLLEVR
jgi:hypothetical protein